MRVLRQTCKGNGILGEGVLESELWICFFKNEEIVNCVIDNFLFLSYYVYIPPGGVVIKGILKQFLKNLRFTQNISLLKE